MWYLAYYTCSLAKHRAPLEVGTESSIYRQGHVATWQVRKDRGPGSQAGSPPSSTPSALGTVTSLGARTRDTRWHESSRKDSLGPSWADARMQGHCEGRGCCTGAGAQPGGWDLRPAQGAAGPGIGCSSGAPSFRDLPESPKLFFSFIFLE